MMRPPSGILTPCGCLFPANTSYDLSRGLRYRMNRNSGLQLVTEDPAAGADFRGVGAVDSVADLRVGRRAQDDGDLKHQVFDGLAGCQIPALGGESGRRSPGLTN